MVLVAQHNCPFCTPPLINKIAELGGKILTVVFHPDGTLYLTHNGEAYIPFPRELPGIPALINDKDVYVGEGPIKKFLSTMEETDARSI